MLRPLFSPRVRALALAIAVLACLPKAAHAQTPVTQAFTYQGELQVSGSVANGLFDFRFRLYDASSAGNQVGADILVASQNVVGGIFSDTLNFGAGAFGPNARWLEIGVRPGGSLGAYTALAPRQYLTAEPVALYALNAASGGTSYWTLGGGSLSNNSGTFVGVNRSTRVTGNEYFGIEAPVASGYGGMYIRTDGAAGLPFYGYSTTGGSTAWTYLDGSTGNWYVHNGSDRLVVEPGGQVGIGTTSPGSQLEVQATTTDAITASSSAAFSNGVHGTGLSAGVLGESGASDGSGVYGRDNTNGAAGVTGATTGTGAGVAGYANSGTGVYGQTSNGYGVYGSSAGGGGYAGYFNGPLHVQGALSKLSGSFKIDHPLDPANKTLSHSFVESPDMMNIYNGTVTTDGDGRAEISMPAWFQALNRDFRYQITPIGQFAQAMVEQEVKDNRFVIRTDKPNVRVSWQVTGIRHDAWADAHRVPVEEDKPVAQRGTYLFPEGYGAKNPGDAGVHGPASAQHLKAEVR